MSCSSNTDSTATLLPGCNDHDDTTLHSHVDSTLLGHCKNHNNKSTLLAHKDKVSAQQMCIRHCSQSMGAARAKIECEKENNTTEKDGSWHWTKPADCTLSCGR